MKKIALTISLLITNIFLLGTLQAYAATEGPCQTNANCGPGEVCNSGVCVNYVDELLPRPGEYGEPTREQYPETATIGDLPEIGTAEVFAGIVKTILGWSMLITLAALVIAGIYYLTSQGDEESLSKAKSTIIYLLLGMAIMAAAYGIVAGVAQFDFFKT
ncbi:MAG: hypothetical protein ABIH78_00375 [Candidatus Peregrinibacteria bacterium]